MQNRYDNRTYKRILLLEKSLHLCGDQSFVIINPQPSEHPTAFTAVAGGDNFKIDLSWTAGAGSQLADGYLIYVKVSAGSFPGNPTDLSAIANDTDFSDDAGVVNVYQVTIGQLTAGACSP